MSGLATRLLGDSARLTIAELYTPVAEMAYFVGRAAERSVPVITGVILAFLLKSLISHITLVLLCKSLRILTEGSRYV